MEMRGKGERREGRRGEERENNSLSLQSIHSRVKSLQ